MIEAVDLCYRVDNFFLQDVNFSLEDGYLMTLLGRNGAGKTTLLELLYGCFEPGWGQVRWDNQEVTGRFGRNSMTYREEVAYVGSRTWCNEECSCKANVDTLQILYGNWDQQKFEGILDYLDFPLERLKQNYKELSLGQKMQLQLAFALARHPKLLLLDEPMANLDPVVKTDLWDLLKDTMAKDGTSIIISTHLLEEVNEISDYIGVMVDGKLVAFGDRSQMLGQEEDKSLRSLLKENLEKCKEAQEVSYDQ